MYFGGFSLVVHGVDDESPSRGFLIPRYPASNIALSIDTSLHAGITHAPHPSFLVWVLFDFFSFCFSCIPKRLQMHRGERKDLRPLGLAELVADDT